MRRKKWARILVFTAKKKKKIQKKMFKFDCPLGWKTAHKLTGRITSCKELQININYGKQKEQVKETVVWAQLDILELFKILN